MRGSIPLLLFCLSVQAAGSARAEVMVWAPTGQAGGSTDSADRLGKALERLGVRVVLAPDLLARDLKSFEAVLAVQGTFPRKHTLTASEEEALSGYLAESKGALYLEGGDAWSELPPRLAELCGIAAEGDGTGDLLSLVGLDARPGPRLSGLALRYRGENRSIDRLRPAGEGAQPLFRNRDTGATVGVFRAAPEGHRVIGLSFELGGVEEDPGGVLEWCLIALGVLTAPVPPVEDLTATIRGAGVVLAWRNGSAYSRIEVQRGSAPPAVLSGTAERFEDEPGPGEHRYRVVAVEGASSPPVFANPAVLDGSHVVWRPVETLAGPHDSAGEVEAALAANGRAAVVVPDLSGLDLRGAAGVWAILGTHPFRHRLREAEGRLLHGYLAGGSGPPRPRLYIEGADLWGRDPPTALRELDGVRPVADSGDRPLRHLRGLDTGEGLDVGALVRLPVDYTAETESIDVILADPGTPGAGPAWVDDDSGDVLGVFRRDPAGRFAVLSVSFEFGGVTHASKERALLMGLYLTALESPPSLPGPHFRRGDVDGDGVLTLTDPIQVLGKLFLAGAHGQDCEDAADADDDGAVSLTDAVLVISHLFLAGPPPAPPGPDCAPDPTPADPLPPCHPLPCN